MRKVIGLFVCVLVSLGMSRCGLAQECKDGTCVLRAIANKVVESPAVQVFQSVVGRADHSTGYQMNKVDQYSIRCDAQPVCSVHPVQRTVIQSVTKSLCVIAQSPVVRVVTVRGCYPNWQVRSVRCKR